MKTLAEYIKFLHSFNRQDCPQEHYQAWKVIVLETNEYNNPIELLSIGYEYFKNNLT